MKQKEALTEGIHSYWHLLDNPVFSDNMVFQHGESNKNLSRGKGGCNSLSAEFWIDGTEGGRNLNEEGQTQVVITPEWKPHHPSEPQSWRRGVKAHHDAAIE